MPGFWCQVSREYMTKTQPHAVSQSVPKGHLDGSSPQLLNPSQSAWPNDRLSLHTQVTAGSTYRWPLSNKLEISSMFQMPKPLPLGHNSSKKDLDVIFQCYWFTATAGCLPGSYALLSRTCLQGNYLPDWCSGPPVVRAQCWQWWERHCLSSMKS